MIDGRRLESGTRSHPPRVRRAAADSTGCRKRWLSDVPSEFGLSWFLDGVVAGLAAARSYQ